MKTPHAIFWFRRDLRLNDNKGLFHALQSKLPVYPIFIFDQNILDELPEDDVRVTFIHQTLASLKKSLIEMGSDLRCFYGTPQAIFRQLTDNENLKAVFFNRDYEPYAMQRDAMVAEILSQQDLAKHSFKDHVIFEKDEVLKDNGEPYTVFTPYKRKWLATLESVPASFQSIPSESHLDRLARCDPSPMIGLDEMGFKATKIPYPDIQVPQSVIKSYDRTRNFPSLENGTSKLGIHFRFGTISIREKARKAAKLNQTYLNELIWRDFYSQILANFPRVATEAFRPAYDRIPWRNNQEEFKAWCQGMTGYPLVDAGMRQLNETGYMHNRVRMVVASFLTKHLLIDWRWGEAYFAQKLLDFDLASNNGGWQWAAGSGTDAAPYFRIFNPESQLQKFDKEHVYVRRWIPEFGTQEYPAPIVDHKMARERCLKVYKEALA
jgi:deoxyribodipyrimidine photo-lyase